MVNELIKYYSQQRVKFIVPDLPGRKSSHLNYVLVIIC